MKLRTSYFNGTALRKDITRFAPVWALYAVFLLLYVMLLQNGGSPAALANNVAGIMAGMVWINLLYAGLCATLLFGDLFQSRMCNALHAMPMRRECWFFTHVAAGMLFAIIPNLIGTLVVTVLLQEYYYMALIWLAVSLLQYLFFFGIAVFSCLCAGSRLAMVAIYGILNFFAGIVYWLAVLFYEPLLYGVKLESKVFEFLMPAFHIPGQDYVHYTYGQIEGGHHTVTRGIWGGFVSESWYYLYAIAAAGLVFLVLSLFVYRRRKLESAGDFISLRPIAPVFLVVYTLCAAGLLYSLAQAFSADFSYIFLGIGLLLGFFTGKMLLDRTVKVFRPKVFLGFALLLVTVAASLLITWLDPLCIGWYIPKTEDIQSAAFYSEQDTYRFASPDSETSAFTSPDEINAISSLHRQLMLEREQDWASACQVRIVYHLKNGRTFKRYYSVPVDSVAGKAVQKRLSDPHYVLRTDDWDSFVESISQINIEEYSGFNNYALTDRTEIRLLMEAVRQDCENGTMVQDWSFHREENAAGWLSISTNVPVGKDGVIYVDEGMDIVYIPGTYVELTVFESCLNTLEFIKNYTPAE